MIATAFFGRSEEYANVRRQHLFSIVSTRISHQEMTNAELGETSLQQKVERSELLFVWLESLKSTIARETPRRKEETSYEVGRWNSTRFGRQFVQ